MYLVLAMSLIRCGSEPAPGPSIRERLDARVEELVAHPRVKVDTYHVGAPTPEADFARIEAELGHPMDPAIRAFYGEIGRLELSWRCLPPGSEDRDPPSTTPVYGLPDYGRAGERGEHANVNLHSAVEVFLTADWTDQVWFPGDEALNNDAFPNGRRYQRREVRPFDTGDHYTQWGLLVQPGATDTPVLFGGDYFAEVQLQTMDFAVWTEMLIRELGYYGDVHDGQCRGVVDGLGIRGMTPDHTRR